jgi:hypothetical protein
VLQDGRPFADTRRPGEDVELILDLDYIVHETFPSTAAGCRSPVRRRSYRLR